jgi:hypothetical protein
LKQQDGYGTKSSKVELLMSLTGDISKSSLEYPNGFHLACLLYAFVGVCCFSLAVDIRRPDYNVIPQSWAVFESLMLWLLIGGVVCSLSALALFFRSEIARTAIVLDLNISLSILLFTFVAALFGISGLRVSDFWRVLLIFALLCSIGSLYFSSSAVKTWCLKKNCKTM